MDDDDVDARGRVRCVTARATPQAIATRWLLPCKHEPLYYYQRRFSTETV